MLWLANAGRMSPAAADHLLRASLVVGVGAGLDLEQRVVPPVGPGGDRLGVPVGAFDQPDLQRRGQRVGRPADQRGQVVGRVVSVRLDDAAEVRAVGEPPADLPQQRVAWRPWSRRARRRGGSWRRPAWPPRGSVRGGRRPEATPASIVRLETLADRADGFTDDVDPREATPRVRLEQRPGRPVRDRRVERGERLADPPRRRQSASALVTVFSPSRSSVLAKPDVPERGRGDRSRRRPASPMMNWRGHLTDAERRRAGRQPVAAREVLGQTEPGPHRPPGCRHVARYSVEVVGGVGGVPTRGHDVDEAEQAGLEVRPARSPTSMARAFGDSRCRARAVSDGVAVIARRRANARTSASETTCIAPFLGTQSYRCRRGPAHRIWVIRVADTTCSDPNASRSVRR